MSPIVESLLFQSFLLLLMVGSVAGLLAGVLLLWQPQRLHALSAVLNRWVSSRHLDTALEHSVALDPWFYRYRQVCGTLTLLAALYIVYFFTVSLDSAKAVTVLSGQLALPASVTGILLDTLALSALFGAMLAIFVSLFLLLRPSQLRDFEQGANRWVSMRRALKPMEIPRAGVDELVFKHGRRSGIVLVLGSVYALTLLAYGLSMLP